MLNRYVEMTPLSSNDFNTCYYCGCESTEFDLAPPIEQAEKFWQKNRASEFLKVPCCYECFDALKGCRAPTIEERGQFAKQKISNRYEKALRIYEMWSEKELPELGTDLRASIAAGLRLGEEAFNRLRFRGFPNESDGQNLITNNVKVDSFEVFGEVYDNFRDALDYASRAYRIQKSTLKDLFDEHGSSFNKAITHVHREMERKEHEKNMKKLCSQFAKDHKQPLKFVSNTVQKFLDEDESISIQEAIDMLHARIKKLAVKDVAV